MMEKPDLFWIKFSLSDKGPTAPMIASFPIPEELVVAPMAIDTSFVLDKQPFKFKVVATWHPLVGRMGVGLTVEELFTVDRSSKERRPIKSPSKVLTIFRQLESCGWVVGQKQREFFRKFHFKGTFVSSDKED